MVALGVSLNLHYCGGKLASISIDLPGDKCCCGEEGMKSCCSDASVSMAMDVDQHVTYTPTFEIRIPIVLLPNWNSQSVNKLFVPQEIITHFPNPPPLKSGAFRIQMGSLTYYG